MPEQFFNEIRMPVADGSSDVGDVSALTPRERQVLAQIISDLPIGGSVGLEVERHAESASHCLMSMYNIH